MKSRQVALFGGSGFIGYHLTRELLNRGYEVEILDIKKPGSHFPNVKFHSVDLLDKEKIRETLVNSNYLCIVNLAAITNDQSPYLSDYRVNFEGCRYLIEQLQELDYQGRFIQISTQYVQKPLGKKRDSNSDQAVNAYGESKKLAEEILRKSKLQNWLILRPTNVWGTYHPGFPDGFWKIVRKGLYLHPNKPVIRSYGFVESVCHQIGEFLSISNQAALKKVYYVGEDPIDSFFWVNAFSKELRGAEVRLVPTYILLAGSIFGEMLEKIGVRFPLNLKRFKSMTTDYVVDMQPTWEVIVKPDLDFEKSVNQTAEWFLGVEK
ncbi:WcaG Nucleoside-diphosphate-sugar epimerases [Candidatus Nanopelagicaceae bacterium]